MDEARVEPLIPAGPDGRRLKPLAECVTNLPELQAAPLQPLDRTVTDARGRVYRYWSDGSLRRVT